MAKEEKLFGGMTEAQLNEKLAKAAKYEAAQAKMKDYDLRYRTEQRLWKEKAIAKGIKVSQEEVLERIARDAK